MRFLDAARLGQNQWWRYLVGLGFILFATIFVGGVPLVAAVMVLAQDGNQAVNVNRATGALVGVDPAVSLALSLAPFAFAFLALLITARVIHGRPAASLVAAGRPIRWGRLALGFLAWLALAAVITLGEELIFPGRYRLTLDLARLLPFAAVAVVLFPLQSSAEELFFRGYLLQGLGLLTRSRLLLAVVTGLVFAGLHLENPEAGSEFWLVMGFYFAFGAALALITLRDDGLELALGIHAANNLFTALVANFKGSAVESPSIFTASGFTPWYSLASTVVGLAVIWILFFRAQPAT